MPYGNMPRMAKERTWFKNRIKEVGKKQIELARILGVESPRIYEISNGERRIQTNEITLTARFLEISEADLHQSLRENRLIVSAGKDLTSIETSFSSVPVVGNVQAGAFIEAFEESALDYIPMVGGEKNANLFALKVIGDSMDIIYPEGTFLVCQRIFDYPKELKDGLKVIVKRRAVGDLFEATVKQFKKKGNVTTLTPMSNNPKYKTVSFKNSGIHHHDAGVPDVEVWAVVVWAISPQG